MRNLVLTLKVLYPQEMLNNKILLIKFIRLISKVSLPDAKSFVDSAFDNLAVLKENAEVHVSVPMTPQALQVLCDFNSNEKNTKVPGVKISVYERPRIFKLGHPPQTISVKDLLRD